MCCFDCELMPKLQHIRVAGKYFADFDIPEELEHLWKYMYHMYQLDAFTQSCPADQDIINHYKQQQGTRMKKHEELETPTFTTSIPASVNPWRFEQPLQSQTHCEYRVEYSTVDSLSSHKGLCFYNQVIISTVSLGKMMVTPTFWNIVPGDQFFFIFSLWNHKNSLYICSESFLNIILSFYLFCAVLKICCQRHNIWELDWHVNYIPHRASKADLLLMWAVYFGAGISTHKVSIITLLYKSYVAT